jgi:hypothetical protein
LTEQILVTQIRSFVKFIPLEFDRFGIWQLAFPNGNFLFLAEPLLIISNILAVIYIAFPFFNRKSRAIHDYTGHMLMIIENV